METIPDHKTPLKDCAFPKQNNEALLAAYGEVCRSYHAIDDFRTKLLGILPIASLTGIFLLNNDNLFTSTNVYASHLVGFGSFFAAAFTLALFLFEIRGIIRCDYLIQRGKALEQTMGVEGQFFICAKQQEKAQAAGIEQLFNAKVAASAVYSLVFAAWLFMAIKFTFGLSIIGCGLTATLFGGGLGIATNVFLNKRIAA